MLSPAQKRGRVLGAAARQSVDVSAASLLAALTDESQAEAVAGELEALLELMDRTEGLEDLLSSSRLGRGEQQELVRRVFRGRCSDVVDSFLGVLASEGRLGLLRATAQRFRQKLNERRRRLPVQVTTAVPLDDALRRAVAAELRETLGAEPVLELAVDPALMGGMVVRIGDHVYDASAAARLDRLARTVAERINAERR